MKTLKELLIVIFYCIRAIFLASSILLMLSPMLLFLLVYAINDNPSLATKVSEFSAPWNMITDIPNTLMLAGITFFLGLGLFFISKLALHAIKKISSLK